MALQPYDRPIATIRAKYAGTPVGASESIFSMLAPSLGLDLITPYSFLKAISEGTEVSAADKATIDGQIQHHQIKIYVYNSQNVTPDVQAQLSEVKAEHIPYTTITETLAPASATYQAWQTRSCSARHRGSAWPRTPWALAAMLDPETATTARGAGPTRLCARRAGGAVVAAAAVGRSDRLVGRTLGGGAG